MPTVSLLSLTFLEHEVFLFPWLAVSGFRFGSLDYDRNRVKSAAHFVALEGVLLWCWSWWCVSLSSFRIGIRNWMQPSDNFGTVNCGLSFEVMEQSGIDARRMLQARKGRKSG
eukprot:c28599_g2_i1 orf=2-337(-)